MVYDMDYVWKTRDPSGRCTVVYKATLAIERRAGMGDHSPVIPKLKCISFARPQFVVSRYAGGHFVG
jgi:hypothetical protein